MPMIIAIVCKIREMLKIWASKDFKVEIFLKSIGRNPHRGVDRMRESLQRREDNRKQTISKRINLRNSWGNSLLSNA
jgi:hypothetical protein